MKITIGAPRNTQCKIGSKLIQLWQGTNYSHVYAKWHLNTQERDIVFQASHGMVHQIALNNFLKDNTVVKEFILELSDDQFKKFSQKCIDLCGMKYSKLELIQIFIDDITHQAIKTEDQKGYICSELMGELLEDFFGCSFSKPNYLLTPKDIIQYLEVNYG